MHEAFEGCPVRGRAVLKLWAGPVDTTTRSRIPAHGRIPRPNPTVPRCTAQSPQVAFRPQQVAKTRARSARGRLRRPEGGPGKARMKTRVITLLLAAGVLAVAALTALSMPAAAQTQTVYVRLADGSIVPVTVDVPPGSSLDDIQLPGTPVPAPDHAHHTDHAHHAEPSRSRPRRTSRRRLLQDNGPNSDGGSPQERSDSGRKVKRGSDGTRELVGEAKGRAKDEISRAKRRGRRSPLRNPDGTPTPSNPGLIDALPGPSTATGVPNFIIRKFRVPPFLLSIYQAAGIEYGIRWEVLAAINEIETDYGRNLNVSSAGALGWMQFMPATWKMYGTDANKDGRKDPFNPVDAIFSAARYLKAANYENDVRAAIWAYNHADWYVDSVLLRARLIAGVPADLIGSLTGLTEGRFPVFARARYADDLAEAAAPQAREARRERRQSRRVGRLAPQHRHLLQAGRARRRRERRRHQEDRHATRSSAATSSSRTCTATATRTPTSARPRSSTRCRRTTADDPNRTARAVHANDERPEARPARLGRPPDRRLGQEAPSATAAATCRTPPPQASAACQGAPVRAPGPPGRPRGRRPRAAARRPGSQERQVRDLQELLLAPVRRRSLEGPPAPAQEGLARDRRHDPRPHRPHASRHGRSPRLLDPPRRPRRADASTRSRSSTAGSCSRPPPSTAPRAATCCTARTTPAPCRSARSCCCRSRCSRSACSPTSASRSTSAAATTSAPARSTAACSPRSRTSPSPG